MIQVQLLEEIKWKGKKVNISKIASITCIDDTSAYIKTESGKEKSQR